MQIDQSIREAKEVYSWIENNKFDSFTKAELTVKMKNIANAERVTKLLDILIHRNIISEPIKEGKKRLRYLVNPALFDKGDIK